MNADGLRGRASLYGPHHAEYIAAVERVQDHTNDVDHGVPNPFWHAPTLEIDALPASASEGGGMQDETGATFTPAEMREAAFELLVLCDLVEGSDPGQARGE